MYTIKNNGEIVIEGTSNENVQEMFSYLRPNFPGIRIEERKGTKIIVGVFTPMILTALVESVFYNAEEPMEPSCI